MKPLGATPLEEFNEAMGDVVVEYFMDEGIDRGRKTALGDALLRLLRKRFGDLPESAEARVKGADAATLDDWLDRMLTAKTLDEVWAES